MGIGLPPPCYVPDRTKDRMSVRQAFVGYCKKNLFADGTSHTSNESEAPREKEELGDS
jgi:hypothetical protein